MCPHSLWNTCFVGLMEFFGPWFYERQYFHNPVNVDISKWLPAGTNGTGTNLIPDGTLYTLQTSRSPLNERAPAWGQVLGQWGTVNPDRHQLRLQIQHSVLWTAHTQQTRKANLHLDDRLYERLLEMHSITWRLAIREPWSPVIFKALVRRISWWLGKCGQPKGIVIFRKNLSPNSRWFY